MAARAPRRSPAATSPWSWPSARLRKTGQITGDPLKDSVAAISVGIVGGIALLDLCYEEDSRADVDMNFVMTGSGQYVEVQGTAESAPFTAARS